MASQSSQPVNIPNKNRGATYAGSFTSSSFAGKSFSCSSREGVSYSPKNYSKSPVKQTSPMVAYHELKDTGLKADVRNLGRSR
ncbi:hypothetical protein HDV06_000134 [Boothiomyces sp. JEL0866]|nr:hypothetical protein HDV06_000134 [Boothiomyces sp. JEL0866]